MGSLEAAGKAAPNAQTLLLRPAKTLVEPVEGGFHQPLNRFLDRHHKDPSHRTLDETVVSLTRFLASQDIIDPALMFHNLVYLTLAKLLFLDHIFSLFTSSLHSSRGHLCDDGQYLLPSPYSI